MSSLPFAISPCPNDTFIFYAWVHQKIQSFQEIKLEMTDIEELNQWALQKKYPLIKASIALLPQLADDYFLLPVGTALGIGCGPKIVASTFFNPSELSEKSILIPGLNTTANALLTSLYPNCRQKKFCSYETIFNRLKQHEADCGLIIHESRFTFRSENLHEIVDLGEEWTKREALPVPLGGFFAHRSLPKKTLNAIVSHIRASLKYSWNHPDESLPYMSQWSQEKDPAIIKKHVELYVSDETYKLSLRGRLAIEKLTSQPLSQVLYEEEASNLCTIL